MGNLSAKLKEFLEKPENLDILSEAILEAEALEKSEADLTQKTLDLYASNRNLAKMITVSKDDVLKEPANEDPIKDLGMKDLAKSLTLKEDK